MGIFVHKTKDAIYYDFNSQACNSFLNIAEKAIKKGQAIKFNDSVYSKLYKHCYDGIPSGEFIKNSHTSGYCYLFALLFARDIKDATLVYGGLKALCSGEMYEPFEHAWIEVGDYCFDTTTKQAFKKDFYYKNYMPEIYDTYTSDQLKDDRLVYLLGLKALIFREEKTPWFVKNFDNIYQEHKTDEKFTKRLDEFFKYYPGIKTYYEISKNNEENTLW